MTALDRCLSAMDKADADLRQATKRLVSDDRLERALDGLSASPLTGAGIETIIRNANQAYARGLGIDLGGY